MYGNQHSALGPSLGMDRDLTITAKLSLELLLLHLVSRDQIAQGKIVDHVFHLLDGVLDRVDALTQDVVLQIEHLEAGVEILDEGADLDCHLVVAQRDRVHGQSAQLIDDRDECEQILLDGDVERVLVLEVDGN